MARRRIEDAPIPPTGRPFTADELATIRRILLGWEDRRGHPHPGAAELEAIHAAAGRGRGFKLWEIDLDVSPFDVERAYGEEITEDWHSYTQSEAWARYKAGPRRTHATPNRRRSTMTRPDPTLPTTLPPSDADASRGARQARRDLQAAYAPDPSQSEQALHARAASYRPENDAEAKRIRETYAILGKPIPARLEIALGYHDDAKAAADALNEKEQ